MGFVRVAKGEKMTSTVIQEWTDEKGWIHRIEIPLTTFLIEHNLEPVVRCKDCRYYHIYWESNGHTEKGYGACDWINDNSVREDHFCSWGERRKDEVD